MWLTSSLSITLKRQFFALALLCPKSFVPADRNRFDLDGFRLLSWKFRFRFPFLFSPFWGTVPTCRPLNDRAREDDDDDERKMRSSRRNYRELRTLRHVSPPGLNILSLSVAVWKFTPCLSTGCALSVFFDVEIESRAKLNTLKTPETLTRKSEFIDLWRNNKTRHDINRYMQRLGAFTCDLIQHLLFYMGKTVFLKYLKV